jgi:hypothetical protein
LSNAECVWSRATIKALFDAPMELDKITDIGALMNRLAP